MLLVVDIVCDLIVVIVFVCYLVKLGGEFDEWWVFYEFVVDGNVKFVGGVEFVVKVVINISLLWMCWGYDVKYINFEFYWIV